MGGRKWRMRRQGGTGDRHFDEASRRAVTPQPGDAAALADLAEHSPTPEGTVGDRRIGWGGLLLPLEPHGGRQDDRPRPGDADRAARQVCVDAGGRAEVQRQGSGQSSKRRAQSVERQVSSVGAGAPDSIRIVSRASPEEGELGVRRVVSAGEDAPLGMERACSSKRAKTGMALEQRVTLSFRMPRVNPECTAKLHKEILEFVANVAPTWEESNMRDAALGRVQGACAMMHLYNVFPFGSKASGLELWNSDIDVVVLGITEPIRDNLGYTQEEKVPVNDVLGNIVSQLRRSNSVRKTFHIRQSRVPIIKCTTVEGVDVDVSVNGDRGIRAARFLIKQQARRPALRPLILLVKAVLKVLGLGDVSQGGLGSFSLANMVIAHLQEEEKVGRGGEDLGVSLLTFLLRYGTYFNYDQHVVAIGRGGIVSRAAIPGAVPTQTHMGTRIFIEDADTLREIAGGTYHMDSVREIFRAAAATLEPLLCQPGAGLPGRAGAGSMLEQLFPVRNALSRTPLELPRPKALPTPLPNPLRAPSPQPDRSAVGLAAGINTSRKSPAGEANGDLYKAYSLLQPASEPGTRVAYTAVFLDPSFRKIMLQWARPKLSEVAADRLVLRSQPDVQHVADAPLGSAIDLSVTGVADDNTVQVLVVDVPDWLQPLVEGPPHVVVSSAENAPSRAAGELVEAVGAGLREGITHTRFPQPGRLKGTLGAQLENGHLFFSHGELRRFWAEEALSEALSETESLLAADEEGLEQLQVVKGAELGFFGSMPPSRAAKPAPSDPLSQDNARELQAALAADTGQGQDAEPQADGGEGAKDRGRWGEQGQLPNGTDEGRTEDAEELGRWGEASDSEAGRQTPPASVPLPLDVSVDRGEWHARQSLTPVLAAALPPHLGARLGSSAAPKGKGPEQNGPAAPASSKHASEEKHASSAGKERPPQEDGRQSGMERRWSTEWPALSRRDGKSSGGDRRVEAADGSRRCRDRERERPERGSSGSRMADDSRYSNRPEMATLGRFMKDSGSRPGRRRAEDRPSLKERTDSARRRSPPRGEERASRGAREGERSRDSKPSRRSVTPPATTELNLSDLPPHLRK